MLDIFASLTEISIENTQNENIYTQFKSAYRRGISSSCRALALHVRGTGLIPGFSSFICFYNISSDIVSNLTLELMVLINIVYLEFQNVSRKVEFIGSIQIPNVNIQA